MKFFIKKVFGAIKKRPFQILGAARIIILFKYTHILCKLFLPKETIKFGKNVRLQRFSTLSAEKPDARIQIGDHSIVYENAKIEAYGQGSIEIGECCVISAAGIYSRKRIRIGKRLLCSWNVFIQDFNPHPVDPELRGKQTEMICYNFIPCFEKAPHAPELDWSMPSEEIKIGDDVWLCVNCTIQKGAKIGSGSIVAPGALVLAGEYPPRSIIAGNPAKVVKQI
jgi:acetyltransferase-like isoleucine patch superfamily enzyme